jgi:hypothetical protein
VAPLATSSRLLPVAVRVASPTKKYGGPCRGRNQVGCSGERTEQSLQKRRRFCDSRRFPHEAPSRRPELSSEIYVA